LVVNSLHFTIKDTKFLMVGIFRDKKTDKFDLVKIKNCNTGTYKNIRYDKLQDLLKEWIK